ncbi:MAG: hypothetical protein ACYCZA_11095 [Thiobacillus sp.]
MNRLTAKLVHGLARLAFWRKPVETTPEHAQFPDPATASRPNAIEAETGVAVEVPVSRASWFARLKQGVRRRRAPAREAQDPDQSGVRAHPSPAQVEASAAVDVVPSPKLSILQWLNNRLRRQPKPEPLEADADALKPGPEKSSQATASGDSSPDDGVPQLKLSFLGRLKTTFRRQSRPEQIEVDASADTDASKPGAETDRKTSVPGDARPEDEADAVHMSRMRRVGALLSNKWVWIPTISTVLLAIIVSMQLMLLQSIQEKNQLQTQLSATQKKLEQASIPKQVAARQNTPGQASEPIHETLGRAADSQSGADAGDCVVTDKASVMKNLKNCIDSFNHDTAR